MSKKKLPTCQQKVSEYIFKYPEIAEFADQQNEIFWTWKEVPVEKDLHELKTNLTESEYHGVITVLKLFTLYELEAGSSYWNGRFKRMFPRPEFQRMGSCFAHFELNTHGPFYNRINEVLGLNTIEFYNSYTDDETLKARMDFIGRVISDPEDLVSIAGFSMVEGAILYSSFAFLKHFQAEGKNKLVNLNAGVSFSLRDEHLHSRAGAYIFQLLLNERKTQRGLTEEQEKAIKDIIYQMAEVIFKHEERIVQMVFEKGTIDGITEKQMINFVKSRIDLCLSQLGMDKIYKVGYNPIGKWFYDNINAGQFHDFFVSLGSEYNRDWDESRFTW